MHCDLKHTDVSTEHVCTELNDSAWTSHYLWCSMYVKMMVKRHRRRAAVQVYTTGWSTSTGAGDRPGKSGTSWNREREKHYKSHILCIHIKGLMALTSLWLHSSTTALPKFMWNVRSNLTPTFWDDINAVKVRLCARKRLKSHSFNVRLLSRDMQRPG